MEINRKKSPHILQPAGRRGSMKSPTRSKGRLMGNVKDDDIDAFPDIEYLVGGRVRSRVALVRVEIRERGCHIGQVRRPDHLVEVTRDSCSKGFVHHERANRRGIRREIAIVGCPSKQ